MPDLTGLSLGRYHILEPLGEGGMAVVYKALDTRLDRLVAVKVIRTERLIPETVAHTLQRFEREARALSKLTHPNIVPVIDYGEFQGKPFLVMPFLPGGTLKRLAGHPIPWNNAVKLLLPIARALAYAHQHGIIHRDVKPSNILVTDSGEPLLSDFGIAKILEGNDLHTITNPGAGVGTPGYMAPEQWTGKTVLQSDIYSLGVLFYELITGRKPYTADTPAAILIKQVNDPLPHPKQFAPGLPDVVEQVLFKALAREPKERYQSMGEMAKAMEGLLALNSQPLPVSERKAEPVRAAPVHPTIKVQEESADTQPVRKSKIWLPIGIAAVLVVVFGSWIIWMLKGQPPLIPAQNISTSGLTRTPSYTYTPSLTKTHRPANTSSATFTPTFTATGIPTNTPTITPAFLPMQGLEGTWTDGQDIFASIVWKDEKYQVANCNGSVEEQHWDPKLPQLKWTCQVTFALGLAPSFCDGTSCWPSEKTITWNFITISLSNNELIVEVSKSMLSNWSQDDQIWLSSRTFYDLGTYKVTLTK